MRPSSARGRGPDTCVETPAGGMKRPRARQLKDQMHFDFDFTLPDGMAVVAQGGGRHTVTQVQVGVEVRRGEPLQVNLDPGALGVAQVTHGVAATPEGAGQLTVVELPGQPLSANLLLPPEGSRAKSGSSRQRRKGKK